MATQFELESVISPGSNDVAGDNRPNWDEIPFPVECARCGHNLRGSEVPQCPACKLRFTWDDAVPLDHLKCAECGYLLRGLKETRCPECGKSFTWKGAIEYYRALTKPLFEYHWRRRPIGAFIYSCRLGLQPQSLWKSVNLHDPPAMAGLLAFVMALLISAMISLTLLVTFSTAVIKSLYALLYIPTNQFWNWYSVGTPYGMMIENAWSWSPGGTAPVVDSCLAPWAYGWQVLGWAVIAILIWFVGGLGALLVLRQSMAACRVRFGHVFRAFIYSVIPIGFTLMACCLLAALGDLAQVAGLPVVIADKELMYPFVYPLAVLFAWSLTTRAIARAYREYIRMPHALAVAVLTQIVAIVFTATVMFVTMVGY